MTVHVSTKPNVFSQTFTKSSRQKKLRGVSRKEAVYHKGLKAAMRNLMEGYFIGGKVFPACTSRYPADEC